MSGSGETTIALHRSLIDVEQSFVPQNDFKLERYTIVTREKIKQLFDDYQYMPFAKRLDKIKKVLNKHLRAKKKELLDKIEEKYDDKLQNLIFNVRDPEKRHVQKNSDLTVQLLQGEESFEEADLVIVPSYVAKGLEFDIVFIINIDEGFSDHELDTKLLYVALTRALHELHIFSRPGLSPLLENVLSPIIPKGVTSLE